MDDKGPFVIDLPKYVCDTQQNAQGARNSIDPHYF